MLASRMRRVCAGVAAGVLATAGIAHAQSATKAVFVAHYYPVNSVSPVGATIAAFRIADDGTATLVENEPSGSWTAAIAISPNGRFLASANATGSLTEELRIYRVESDASLTPLVVGSTLNSPLDMTWVSNDVLVVVKTQSGQSQVRSLRYSEAANTLTLVDAEWTGYFNSAVVKHPTQPWIYAQDSGVFGGIPRLQQIAVEPTGHMSHVAYGESFDPPLKPTISPDGKWIFSGTGAFGANSVAVWSVDPVTGNPSEINAAGSPFFSPGDTPYRTAVTTDNQFVYVGHTVDDTVRPFMIDQMTGAILATEFSFDAGPRGSLGPMAVLDDFLIVIKDSNDPIGMWVFRIEPNGDLTQIGPLHDTGNRRPEMNIAVWSPPAAPPCAVDLDGDGMAQVGDLFAYLNLWFANDAAADFNGQDGVTLQDIFDYLTAWFAGC